MLSAVTELSVKLALLNLDRDRKRAIKRLSVCDAVCGSGRYFIVS